MKASDFFTIGDWVILAVERFNPTVRAQVEGVQTKTAGQIKAFMVNFEDGIERAVVEWPNLRRNWKPYYLALCTSTGEVIEPYPGPNERGNRAPKFKVRRRWR